MRPRTPLATGPPIAGAPYDILPSYNSPTRPFPPPPPHMGSPTFSPTLSHTIQPHTRSQSLNAFGSPPIAPLLRRAPPRPASAADTRPPSSNSRPPVNVSGYPPRPNSATPTSRTTRHAPRNSGSAFAQAKPLPPRPHSAVPSPPRPHSAAPPRPHSAAATRPPPSRPESAAGRPLRPGTSASNYEKEKDVISRIPVVRRLLRRRSDTSQIEDLVDDPPSPHPHLTRPQTDQDQDGGSPSIKRQPSWARTLTLTGRLKKKKSASTLVLSPRGPRSPKATGRLTVKKSRESLKRARLRRWSQGGSPIPPVPSLPSPFTSGLMASDQADAPDEMGVPRVASEPIPVTQDGLGVDLPPFPQALLEAVMRKRAMEAEKVATSRYATSGKRYTGYSGSTGYTTPASTTFPAAIADTSPTVPKFTPEGYRHVSEPSLDAGYDFCKAQRVQAEQTFQNPQNAQNTEQEKPQSSQAQQRSQQQPRLKKLPSPPASRPPQQYGMEESAPDTTPTRQPAARLSLKSLSPLSVSAFDSEETPTKPKSRASRVDPHPKPLEMPATTDIMSNEGKTSCLAVCLLQ